MKLYTEEQLKKAIKLAQRCEHDCGGVYFEYEIEDVLEDLTSIELPSDEEIKTYLNNHSYQFEHGFKDAIEFIKNKIQGGNNEQQ